MFKRRRRFRSRTTKLRRKHVFMIVFILFLVFAMQSFIYIEKNLRPHLMAVAKIRIKQVATEAINAAITEKIANDTNLEKLIEWKTDRNENITGFMLNYAEHMRISSQTVNIVQNTLNHAVERKDRIPLGEAFESAIIASYGPTVPIRFVPEGAVKIDLNTRQKDAGINMLLIEVYIRIMTEVTVIIPFHAETEIVETEIPISYLLVVGDVPMYYFNQEGEPLNKNGAPPPGISIPGVDPKKIFEEEQRE